MMSGKIEDFWDDLWDDFWDFNVVYFENWWSIEAYTSGLDVEMIGLILVLFGVGGGWQLWSIHSGVDNPRWANAIPS